MQKLVRIATIPASLRVLLKDQMKFMSSYYSVIAIASNDPLLKVVEKEQGVRTVGIDMTRKITPFKDFIALFKLYKFFRKEKPQIVHTHTPKAGLLGMVSAKLANVPVRMHTVAGLPLTEATGIKKKILVIVEKITYWCANQIYPNSFHQAEYIIDKKFTNKTKVKVIGNGSSNGIDTAFFNPALYNEHSKQITRNQYQIDNESLVLCFIGRVVKDKGITELVNVFTKIIKKYKNITLLLVGPFEPELDKLDDKTEFHILNNQNIKWVGFQEDVRPFLSIADIFVFPSYREGFPNSVMQAGAMGLPSIVTDINGCNEIIVNNKNGLIVSPKSSRQLYDAVELLIKNKCLREEMALVSREMIVSRYNREYLWHKLLEEYKYFTSAEKNR